MLVKVKNFKIILDAIENKNIKFIFLDLDNTLYCYDPCHQYALKACYLEFRKLSQISYDKFIELYKNCGKHVKKQLKKQASGHSRLLYFQKMFEVVYGKTDIQKSLQFEEIYWQNFFKKMKIKQEVVAFFKEIRKKDIKVVIVTDLTVKLQFEKILYLKLSKFIDFVVTSEEVGVEKPHKKIFDIALKKVNAKKEESIMIGDDLERDGQGGKNMGILTYIIEL